MAGPPGPAPRTRLSKLVSQALFLCYTNKNAQDPLRPPGMKIAVFDIGTNSIHMKLIQIHENLTFEVLDHQKDATRIGEGSFKRKKLTRPAMRRALKVLSLFARIARKEGATRMIAIATSAVRDAKNSDAFVRALYKKTRIRARVISGEEEGRLIYLGACSNANGEKRPLLAIDVGGGSAEFIEANRRRIYHNFSFPLGGARLRDRFMKDYPPSKGEIASLEEYVLEKLEDALQAFEEGPPCSHLVGTGGTMINLASMVYEAKEKRPLRLRGFYELAGADLKRLCKKLVTRGVKRAKRLPGIDKKRADLMPTGAVLIRVFLKVFKTKKIMVSDKGIREGVVLDFIARHKMGLKKVPPCLAVQWLGQKPFFSGRILNARRAGIS